MSAPTVAIPGWFGGIKRFAQIPRWMLATLAAGILVLVAVVTFFVVRSHTAVSYVTKPIVRQTLVLSVTASGTVNPQNTITVGTQVSGIISALYVDFNSKVKTGEVLARIDPSTIQAQLDQADADFGQAQASATEAGANTAAQAAGATAAQTAIPKAQAALSVAQEQLTRDQSLLSQGYVPQETVQTDQSTVAQDQAVLAQAQAAFAQSADLTQAQGAGASAATDAVQAAEATVQEDTINLNNTVITSPVDGTVVARDVSVGQTVAASLAAPTLFSIAQNLDKMEVDINVGEPDIGGIAPGNTVTFTVLAYPTTTFTGSVTQVRINPQTLNNVVTYDVVVDVANPKGTLLPGMTANATIDTASAANALIVPLAALSFGLATSAKGSATTGSALWGQTLGGASSGSTASTGVVFVKRGEKLEAEHVTVVLANSTEAAVSASAGSTLDVGDLVVVSQNTGGAAVVKSATHAAPTLGGSSSNATRGIH
ncbi:MAG: efflux RND transporter periplasmic adaptor subunit [Candidatus Aquilonibacter sp.]|jgi:HlyD family secretion protein